MKTTISAICLMAALAATAGQALAQGADSDMPASRWSSSVMDRHMPLDAVQLQKLGQRKFRYMDSARIKPSSAIHNAVIVHGPVGRDGQAQPDADIRRPSQRSEPVVVMRPMT